MVVRRREGRGGEQMTGCALASSTSIFGVEVQPRV